MMRRLALVTLAALSLTSNAFALGRSADIEIIDGASGRVLPVYRHYGHYYVPGEPGHEYRIRLVSHEPGRLLAVASVDGVNVVSGETASPDQTGYILDAYSNYDVLGWRKSLDHVASFYFTSLPDSYAARTGRARDVGVIGVALFREKPPQPVMNGMLEDRAVNEPAPPSASAPMSQPYAAAGSSAARDAAAPAQKAESRLGTGHGRNQDSTVVNADFERASNSPSEIVAIYYDSRSNLVAQGIIPADSNRYRPNPFPNGFVPDP
jgi:hypothetical protein